MRGRYGEYGSDELSRCLLWASLILIALTLFTWGWARLVFDFLLIAVIVYCWFRLLSRDIPARRNENLKYLSATENLRRKFRQEKRILGQRKDYHFYTCPGCRQKIRMPRGKGRVEITCPKCREKFVRNT